MSTATQQDANARYDANKPLQQRCNDAGHAVESAISDYLTDFRSRNHAGVNTEKLSAIDEGRGEMMQIRLGAISRFNFTTGFDAGNAQRGLPDFKEQMDAYTARLDRVTQAITELHVLNGNDVKARKALENVNAAAEEFKLTLHVLSESAGAASSMQTYTARDGKIAR